MLDPLHGTSFQRTYVPTKIAQFSGNSSKLTFFTLAKGNKKQTNICRLSGDIIAAKATYIRLFFWQKGGFSALAP